MRRKIREIGARLLARLTRAADREQRRMTPRISGVVSTGDAGSRRWDCPLGHLTVTSSALMTSVQCYCGRSMIEGRGTMVA